MIKPLIKSFCTLQSSHNTDSAAAANLALRYVSKKGEASRGATGLHALVKEARKVQANNYNKLYKRITMDRDYVLNVVVDKAFGLM